MIFHVVAIPQTKTNKQFSVCAFTQNCLNFCKMMNSCGHKVYHYGVEGSEVDEFAEHVTVLTDAEQRALLPKVPHHEQIHWDLRGPVWGLFNARAVVEIAARAEVEDFICLSGGGSQVMIANAFPDNKCVEYTAGYTGCFSPYKVFPSNSHRSYIGGKLQSMQGSENDTVIPHYFDVEDFPFVAEPDDYFLYIGRVNESKGVGLAVQVANQLQKRMVIAGPGIIDSWEGGKPRTLIVPAYGDVREQKIRCRGGSDDHVLISDEHVVYRGQQLSYAGVVHGEAKAKLLGNATAVLMPSQYYEPLGCVQCEAMLCGTPVIATNWGSFPEVIEQGVTGYCCSTFPEFVAAADKAPHLNRREICAKARANWSLDVIKHRYEEYFNRLSTLPRN